LTGLGVKFFGTSDTEVLLAGIEVWGLFETLNKVAGMFAFALFDVHSKVLSLVRDRLGEKPLYYGRCGKSMIFASELSALRRYPDWNAGIDRDAIASLLRYNYIPAPQTIYKGFYKLLPGACLRIRYDTTDLGTKLETWWDLNQFETQFCEIHPKPENLNDAVEEVDHILRLVMSEQCSADVDVGAFLSAGIDSSVVVSLASLVSNRQIKTFTLGFAGDKNSEVRDAAITANLLGTKHTELVVEPKDVALLLPEVATIYDEPFADSSQIPTILISRLAGSSVKVSLSGDGGDEVFGGYNRYTWGPKVVNWYSSHPFLKQLVTSFHSDTGKRKVSRRLEAIFTLVADKCGLPQARDKLQKLVELSDAASGEDAYKVLTTAWKDPVPVHDGVPVDIQERAIITSLLRKSLSEQFMFLDKVTYLPDDILVKVDRASMSVGLEVRCPFLDHRIVGYAANLPTGYKINNSVGKRVLRELASRYIPLEHLSRPKSGFALPIDTWLRTSLREWAEDLLSPSALSRHGVFDVEEIRKAWKIHIDDSQNRHELLWSVLMFQSWINDQSNC